MLKKLGDDGVISKARLYSDVRYVELLFHLVHLCVAEIYIYF